MVDAWALATALDELDELDAAEGVDAVELDEPVDVLVEVPVVEVPVLEPVDVLVEVPVDVLVEVPVLDDVPVVALAVALVSAAELCTPATRPTVVTPATAAAVQPAILVRRRRRSGEVSGGCSLFMAATMGSRASGPHHANVKTVLRPAGSGIWCRLRPVLPVIN